MKEPPIIPNNLPKEKTNFQLLKLKTLKIPKLALS